MSSFRLFGLGPPNLDSEAKLGTCSRRQVLRHHQVHGRGNSKLRFRLHEQHPVQEIPEGDAMPQGHTAGLFPEADDKQRESVSCGGCEVVRQDTGARFVCE